LPLLEKLSPGKTGFFPALFHFNLCSGSRSGGSVIYWPPGSVSVIWITNPDQNPYYLSKLQQTFRKVYCFIIFNDIPGTTCLTTFFPWPQKCSLRIWIRPDQ
jgi:hypothetical protein